VSSDQIAFLNAICTNPNDDLARLVYADWIEEQGDSARAEFIRIQIERFRSASNDREARQLSWREYELLREHEYDWRQELPEQLQSHAIFRRGFVYRIECSLRELLEATRDHILRDPVEVLSVYVDSLDPEWLAYHPPPLTLPLSDLQIRCPLSVGPLLVTALVRYGPFPRLKRLRIADANFGDDGVSLLRATPTFPEVNELDLSFCGIGDRGAEELAESEWLTQLTSLRLTGNMISAGRLQWLRHRFGNALVS